MVILTVGGWFASAAIAKLKEFVSSYVEEQLKYQKGLKNKLQKLRESLIQIEAIVVTAEQNQDLIPSLIVWLDNLKDAVFDAEDVLDLFNYRIIENQVNGSGISKVLNSMKKEVPNFGRRLLFLDVDINKLIGVIERFDKLYNEMNNFLLLQLVGLNSSRPTKELEHRETTPISVEAKVYGRGNDIKKLLKLLESSNIDSETNSQSYATISIAGMGGVGKTTLLEYIYNLPEIERQFNLQAWVYVSTKFSIREITIKIIESAGIPRPSDLHQLIGLGAIQEVLKNELKDKKFLIVLDDVWSEVNSELKSKWETLAAPFRFGSKGSRVVVTTRNQNVPREMEANKIINLEVLEDEDFQELFTQCAFGGKNPKDFPVLEAISKKISQKLGGLPLAAKTVGSVLRNRIEEQHWFSVLNNNLWEVDPQADRMILDSLELSYSHLPAPMKQCFVFCALFPKNHLFKRDDMLHYWVALGYVNTEVDGKRCFDELESRFFFQKYKDKSFYVVHDLLHDVAEYVCQDEICRVETNDGDIKKPKAVRHLYVSLDNLDEFVKKTSDIIKLRSLVIDRCTWEDSDRKSERSLIQFFRQLKGLRILIYYDFNYRMKDLPFDLRVHLRYFRLKKVSKLPQLIHKLYHLQVLDIEVHEVYKWGPEFSLDKLINLRYLRGDRYENWSKYRIGRQTSLQQLEKPFAVERKEGHRIRELCNLKQLRGNLYIKNLYNVKGKKEAEEAELKNKKLLDTLILDWSSRDFRPEAMALDEGVIGGLVPNRNLKSLKLFRYAGRSCPLWLEESHLHKLQVIELEQCHQLQEFSPIGQLPYLKILKLKNLDSLEFVGLEIYGRYNASAFPLLETLELSYMKNLTEWVAIEDGRQLFPLLRKLIIDHCPKLIRPIPLSSSVKEFEFISKYDGISSFTNCLPTNSLAGLQSLYCGIGYGFEAFTAEQEEWFQKLTSLKEVKFAGHSLISLPSSLKNIPSLDCIYILGCQVLQLAEDGLPNCLKELHVKGNGEFIKRNWHKISYIPTITHEGKPIYHPVFFPFAT